MPNICVVLTKPNVISETFIAAHIERLKTVNCVVHRMQGQPAIDGSLVLSQTVFRRAIRKLSRMIRRVSWSDENDRGYLMAFKKSRADVVLAEYGENGAAVMEACRQGGIPLVVHFHGYDASRHQVIAEMREGYTQLFGIASACVVVSQTMKRTLLQLGCPSGKLVCFPYGVEGRGGGREVNQSAGFQLIGVGRLVEKKAPYLTLLAFAKVLERFPQARLTLIGDGPLLPVCRQIAESLNIHTFVRFLGAQPHGRVKQELRNSDMFVQHSIVASDGDSEGTPVAVLEASAMGLPVVATRHAGIPDVVIHGETGLLSQEGDIDAMAENICSLLEFPARREQMGRTASEHVLRYYTLDQSIQRLQQVLDAAASGNSVDQVRTQIEESLPRAEPKTVAFWE